MAPETRAPSGARCHSLLQQPAWRRNDSSFFIFPHEGYSAPQAAPQLSAGGLQVDFESVFGAKASGSNSLHSEGDWFYFGGCKDLPISPQSFVAQEQPANQL